MKAATTAFTFKTLLRHYASRGLLRDCTTSPINRICGTTTDLPVGEDLAVHLAAAHEDLSGEDCDAGEDAPNVHAGHAPPLLQRNY